MCFTVPTHIEEHSLGRNPVGRGHIDPDNALEEPILRNPVGAPCGTV
jgi:hypothetical protein